MSDFELTDDDRFAINIAESVARKLLRHRQLSPRRIVGLGNALYALQRLPNATQGAFCEFGVVYSAGTKEFRETRYIDFKISESSFAISRGGSVYEQGIGSDSYSDPGWLVESGGYRETGCDLPYLEDSIDEYLNLGAEISVTDESSIEYE